MLRASTGSAVEGQQESQRAFGLKGQLHSRSDAEPCPVDAGAAVSGSLRGPGLVRQIEVAHRQPQAALACQRRFAYVTLRFPPVGP